MIGINHALTGALVAVSINKPAIALPAALLSHFAIDMIPHWNYKVPGGPKLRQTVIGFDMIASTGILVLLGLVLDVNFWVFTAGGVLGMLPDIMWLPYIISGKPAPRDKNTPLHILRRFHLNIQWSETSRGLFIELAWLILMSVIVIKL